jgi:methylenetetrahydrofolate dehydrogenase (NADP+)/methenyltetrahydrofolate cyclohydrolase
MSAILMDGKALGIKVRESVKARAAALCARGVAPCLAVVLVGEDSVRLSYVMSKEKALAEAGMESRDIRLPQNTGEAELLSLIAELNKDEKVHGILVQSPVPKHIDEEKIISAVDPKKDVDCFHPISVGNMILGKPGFLPCTPHGVLVLLKEYKVPISGSHAVVVGRSNIVGKPLANLLSRREYNATVTLCHTGTKGLANFTKEADILIVAARSHEFIKPEMIKEGAAVIDVGINRVPDSSFKKGYRVCGDVDSAVAEKAGFYTPVPGGVGPMTIAMLLQNVADAAERCI